MLRKIAFGVLAVTFLISLNGCATFGKKKDLEAQELKNHIQSLETQLRSKDQEIIGLREDLDRAMQEKQAFEGNKGIIESKSQPSAKDIQLALINAGYNPGKVDGRIGKQTIEAIKSFQKAHNLVADGKVGKKTWAVLRAYTLKKTK